MTLKIAINGFGRIGRTVLRVLAQRADPGIEIVAINDPAPAETLAHLFQFDSLHGRFAGPVVLEGQTLDIGFGGIRMTHESDPRALGWSDVDIALECSGQFTQADDALRHLENGSTKVLLSAPVKGPIIRNTKTIVYGVNHTMITPQDRLISNASCTTNCLVPVAHVLHQAFGIRNGMMTTVHSYTGNQPTHDAAHADLYRGRAAAVSMVPTSTGAAETLGDVLPDLAGKITGQAIRVPTPNVSCVDLTVDVAQNTTVADVNAALMTAAQTSLRGIIGVEAHKLVSIDFARDPHSATLASDQTRVQGAHLVRVLAWYDNEWGFSNRMLDTAKLMGNL